jgi:hypothetical protein
MNGRWLTVLLICLTYNKTRQLRYLNQNASISIKLLRKSQSRGKRKRKNKRKRINKKMKNNKNVSRSRSNSNFREKRKENLNYKAKKSKFNSLFTEKVHKNNLLLAYERAHMLSKSTKQITIIWNIQQ